jgi:hypothetical protein
VSTPPDWLTIDDVAAYLDLPVAAGDDNLATSTATVKAAVERRRSDLWVGRNLTADPPEPGVFTPSDEVKGGSIIWAAILYQARSSPSGFSGYGDETMIFDALGARRAEVMRLIGWRRPVAI